MNIRRKFLRTVDLRVQQHLAGLQPFSTYQLGRIHSIESLLSDYPNFRAFPAAKESAQPSSL